MLEESENEEDRLRKRERERVKREWNSARELE